MCELFFVLILWVFFFLCEFLKKIHKFIEWSNVYFKNKSKKSLTFVCLLTIISLIHRICKTKTNNFVLYVWNLFNTKMIHPWKDRIQEIRARGWTQKHFSLLLWKKVSEVNELIKWKRNITIQRDLLLSKVLWSPEKFRMNKQIDYDYIIAKQNFDESKIKAIKTEDSSLVAPQKQFKKPQQEEQPQQKHIQHKNRNHEGIFQNF